VGGLSAPLQIALGLALLLVAGVVLLGVRRVALARRLGSFDCSVRMVAEGRSWTVGVARYGPGRLDWYRVFSLSPRPSRSWQRSRLEVVGQRVPVAGEVLVMVPDLCVISCRYDGDELDLAMSAEAYTGLASWAEAGPPGQVGRVT
jgi:hypothetical protein